MHTQDTSSSTTHAHAADNDTMHAHMHEQGGQGVLVEEDFGFPGQATMRGRVDPMVAASPDSRVLY